MQSKTPCWGLAPVLLLGAASLSLADDVSLVGDYRFHTPQLTGHLQIDDGLSVRVVTEAGESKGAVERRADGTAILSAKGSASVWLELRARSDGGFVVIGGGELTRQRTFPPADVERAKTFLQANAKSIDNLDCITTINYAVRMLFRNPSARVGSQMDWTMNRLADQSLAGRPLVIEFLNAKGKKTTGVTEPETLQESVFQALRTMTRGERGWSVFGLSIMDGYHSVLLFLDANDPANPRVYWADQWSSKGGFKEYTGAELDEEIQSRTNSWWSESKKPRSRATLWRLRPQARGQVQVATVKAPRLNLRAGPSADDDKVGRTFRGDTWQVVAKRGAWRRLISSEGEVAWAHGGYLRYASGSPAEVSLPVFSSGIASALGN